jgi:hypothetical protein
MIALAFGLYVAAVVLPKEKAHQAQMQQKNRDYYESRYVDPQEWAQGRVCDKLQWKCLPESNDTKRWSVPLSNGLDSFELTPEVMHKYRAIIQRWRDEEDGKIKEQNMKLSQLSEAFYDRVEAKKFLSEMEESLGKEFPGFWRDVPMKVRYRWIQRAMNKAKKFGLSPKKNNQMVELCARIGLDFDKDPKWKTITEFIALDPKNHLIYANAYIDFTVFNKDYNRRGIKFTDWSLGRCFPFLPKPKRPIPKLNDL